jgi:hypothetical protein
MKGSILYQISLMMLLLLQTKAYSLNMCEADQKAIVYIETIATNALIEKQTTLFYEKIFYFSVATMYGLVATNVANTICTPITAALAPSGPMSLAVGTSCYLGTTATVYKILPMPEKTVQDDFDTVTISNYNIMKDVSYRVCDVMSNDFPYNRFFIYVIKQKSLDNKNDLEGMVIEEIVKINKNIELKGLIFVPIFLSKTLDYEIGLHYGFDTEATLLYTEGNDNFFLIKTLKVLF